MNFSLVRHATCIISSRQALTQVLDELRAIDFPMQKIFVFNMNSEHEKSPKDADASHHTITSEEGAKAGAITGGTAGGILALIGGLGIIIIPGVGPALAIESVLATLLASGASAAVGGLYGAFQGWLAPERLVRLNHPSTSPEEFLVTLEGTGDEIRQAEYILRHRGVREWHVCELKKRFSS
ncbi:hypothetical protein [Fortiea contorta]|uniref:hypothetical protein n=1 Tax=Fortiea contorta TaxID=1892405 RepID=UPI00037E75DE|nr:hypothetical protein [Fortiea contorta]